MNSLGRPIDFDRIQEYQDMRRTGASREQIARSFGIKPKSLERWCQRHNLDM